YLAKLSLSSETTVDYKPRARVYSPSGETVGAELDSGDTKTLTLTQAGTHVIQVYDLDYTHTQTELINRGKAPEYTVHLQDAQSPFVQSVTVSDPLLTDLDAGPAKFAVTVVFSETMDPANVPTLVYGNSAVTGGPTPTLSNPSVNWSASTVANDTVTITYDVADRGLNAENITIGVTGAKDLAGNLQQGYSPESEFSIDTRNPVVSVFTPRDNATRVAPAANLVMTFGEPIQKGTGSILVKRSSDDSTVETIPMTSAQVTVSGATATIDPAALLLESTGYYVEVSAGAVRDLAGNDSAGISGGAAWNFTTGDFTPPALVSLSPADEATGVAWDASLSLVFGEAVQPGVGQITIKRSSDGVALETVSVPGSQVTVSGMTVTIDPAAALADNTSYFVELTSGAIEDLAGNAFPGVSGPSAWNFTAADVPPTVLALSPSDEAAGVVLEANLLIMFDQPIRKGSGNIVIKRSSDDSTFQTISVQDTLVTVSGPLATIHPATLLERREGYYVEIAAAAFEDFSGHPFAGISGPEGWDFTTVGPLVSDDAGTAQEDTPSNLDVLSNDSGLGRPVDPATLAIVAGPTHGTAAVHNGLVIYTPAANFSGGDTFRYTVRDVVGFESEAGTVTITVTEVSDYQNPNLPEDVNRSGAVTPLDVLIGINRINAFGSQLPPDPLPPAVPVYYYDVDGNNALEPLDLLIIINYLNQTSSPGQGEGESGDGGIEPLAAAGAARSLPVPSLERAETDNGADERQRIRLTSAHSDLASRRGISPDRPGANRLSSAWSRRHDAALAALQQPTADLQGLALDEVLALLAADWAQAGG
ncbi:MAG: Ig-like domain-containing protein, partial [Pirellulaceae bacterium]|nr:Ig-like domain-containing protein [Pirellulaceae bacterium]